VRVEIISGSFERARHAMRVYLLYIVGIGPALREELSSARTFLST
jgi:hypothetical protein